MENLRKDHIVLEERLNELKNNTQVDEGEESKNLLAKFQDDEEIRDLQGKIEEKKRDQTFLQEKYKIDDEIFDWFDFMLNGFSLFGILPGILLKILDPKKTAVLGGIFIVFGQMMAALMVSTEHKEIAKNPAWMLGSICAIAG